MKRVNAEEFRRLMLDVSECPFISDIDVCNKAGFNNQSQYSRFKYGENNPNAVNQERIIKGILSAIDDKILCLSGSDIPYAQKLIDKCFKLLINGSESKDLTNLAHEYLDMCSEYKFDYFNLADEIWKDMLKLSHAELKWLDLYYDTIDSNFRMDMEYIKQAKYPDDFKPKKDISVNIEELVDSLGLKKTLNCIFFGKFSADKYISQNKAILLSDDEIDRIRIRFIKRIVDYCVLSNTGEFLMAYDSYTETLINNLSLDMDEYLPNYPFMTYIKLMLSITSDEWLMYGEYRLSLIK